MLQVPSTIDASCQTERQRCMPPWETVTTKAREDIRAQKQMDESGIPGPFAEIYRQANQYLHNFVEKSAFKTLTRHSAGVRHCSPRSDSTSIKIHGIDPSTKKQSCHVMVRCCRVGETHKIIPNSEISSIHHHFSPFKL